MIIHYQLQSSFECLMHLVDYGVKSTNIVEDDKF